MSKIKNFIKRQLNKRGYTIRKINNNTVGTLNDGFQVFEDIVNPKESHFSKEDFAKRDDSVITLNWVVPIMGVGSGGHLNIFRAIHHLSTHGIVNNIYIHCGDPKDTTESLRKFVKTNYEFDLGRNQIYPNTDNMEYADGTVATSWNTAYIVNNFENTVSKFYFVQDCEPFFFAVGSNYYLAENTYRFGFRGVTAGDWLKNKLNKEYGMETESFRFAYDRNLYYPKQKKDNANRVFFYARPCTERRAFEIGCLAFTILAKKIPDVEIVFAGQDLGGMELPFKYTDLKTVELSKLCDVYSQCDMCLVISSTNLSLLPMEVMASNSVVVGNYGANNEWLLNNDNSILVNVDPVEIAEKIAYYLEHKDELQKFRENGQKAISDISWENEFAKAADFIIKSVNSDIEGLELN